KTDIAAEPHAGEANAFERGVAGLAGARDIGGAGGHAQDAAARGLPSSVLFAGAGVEDCTTRIQTLGQADGFAAAGRGGIAARRGNDTHRSGCERGGPLVAERASRGGSERRRQIAAPARQY